MATPKGSIGAMYYGEQKALWGARFFDTIVSSGGGGGPVLGASVKRKFPVEDAARLFPRKNLNRMFPVT